VIEIVLIVAVADNGVIGAGGAIPWRLKSDMQRLRAMTIGRPVVMGRKTFLSLKRPLPHRTNIVVTRDGGFRAAGAVVTTSLDSAGNVARADALRRSVAEIAVEVSFGAGEELVRQGEPVARFLVLLAGRAEVRKGKNAVDVIGAGDFVGEIGLVSRSPATATVTALEPVQALAVTTLAFRALLRRVPSLTDRVLEALAARTAR